MSIIISSSFDFSVLSLLFLFVCCFNLDTLFDSWSVNNEPRRYQIFASPCRLNTGAVLIPLEDTHRKRAVAVGQDDQGAFCHLAPDNENPMIFNACSTTCN